MKNREIKFKRAFFFDEEKTKFSHFDSWGVDIDGANFKSPSSNNFAQYFTDLQFTGKFDKNGKEIYESDVVRVNGMKRSGLYITTVIFKNQGFTLAENKTYLNNDSCINRIAIGVIGNIYQNPELLTTPIAQ